MLRLSLLFLITMLSSSFAQNREANPEDVSTVDGVMNAYYEAVSGPPGKRDFKRIQTLYLPGAKLNVNSVDGTLLHGLVEEVLMSERFQTISTDFYEREISRDEHRFGDMANVISTYGISDAMANTDYTARGVTVFQLRKHDGRWWVLSSMWQREGEGLPIPANLLD